MQTVRIGQAVVLLSIVAMASSCAASKEYTSKLFTPRNAVAKDSEAVALRFLELDNLEPDQDNWVSTDIIMGRDTASKTLALDKLAKVYPATTVPADTSTKSVDTKSAPVLVAKPLPVQTEPVKTSPVEAEVKPAPAETEPVAKAANPGEVRSKRSRD